MESQPVMFREYAPEDLGSCARLAKEAWPLRPGIATGIQTDRMMEAWMGGTVSSSTWAEVAVDEHGIVGVLFGEIKGQPHLRRNRSTLGIELSLLARGFMGSFGNLRHALWLMLSFLVTEFKLLVNRPKSDAEITILIVGQEHRGRGLGKQLVDRFVDAARKAGAKSVSLYTEDQTSNWRFYEAYGFRRVAEFRDTGTSHYVGKDAKAIIYMLDL